MSENFNKTVEKFKTFSMAKLERLSDTVYYVNTGLHTTAQEDDPIIFPIHLQEVNDKIYLQDFGDTFENAAKAFDELPLEKQNLLTLAYNKLSVQRLRGDQLCIEVLEKLEKLALSNMITAIAITQGVLYEPIQPEWTEAVQLVRNQELQLEKEAMQELKEYKEKLDTK